MSTMPLAQEVYYPESDGRPMAETEAHGQVMIDLWTALRRRYASVPDVYAWGQIDDYTDAQLQALVRWIESDTLLRSRDDLISEVMSELGFARRGKKIVGRIGAAIDAVRGASRAHHSGDHPAP